MNCPYCDNPIPSGAGICPACGAPVPDNQKKSFGTGFFENFKKVFTTQYFCFNGRMSRHDFWMFLIPVLIVCFIPYIGTFFGIVFLIPVLGATARRLHDIGKTGWLSVLWFICPPIGIIILLLFCLKDGNAETNKYGEPPA